MHHFTVMKFTAHMNEQKVTYDVFPEVWELLAGRLLNQKDNIHIQQLYMMINYIGQSGY